MGKKFLKTWTKLDPLRGGDVILDKIGLPSYSNKLQQDVDAQEAQAFAIQQQTAAQQQQAEYQRQQLQALEDQRQRAKVMQENMLADLGGAAVSAPVVAVGGSAADELDRRRTLTSAQLSFAKTLGVNF